jgi:hemoglobin
LFERLGGRDALSDLLRHFYADVRQHNLIGPIFAQAIEDWPTHLDTIGAFWTRVTGGPSNYSGPVYQAHMPLNLRGEHFEAWLNLWQRHCQIRLPEDAAAEMVQIARAMAHRLRSVPGVPMEQS